MINRAYMGIFLFLIILIFYMIWRRRSSATMTTFDIKNEQQTDRLAVKQAIEVWNKKLQGITKINIILSRKDVKTDIHVAETTINSFSFQIIDATITLYPVFNKMSTKDKTIALIHEIGHILGIGTRWPDMDTLTKENFPRTINEFNKKFNKNVSSIKVHKGHWDEPELADDIMSSSGCDSKKISSITLANLQDLGWKI